MEIYHISVILIVLAASFGYINARFLKLPLTIGLMVVSIVFSVGLMIAGVIDDRLLGLELEFVKQIAFDELLLEVMLSFLLFAGALHVDFQKLKAQRWPILLFATIGVLISTVLIGLLSYGLLSVLGLNVALIHCMLFGALISPTDPIAVLGILKKAGVAAELEAKIAGESLFNDGVGVVIFLTLYDFASGEASLTGPSDIALLFVHEVGGGILLGLALGALAYTLMRRIHQFEVELLISLALVMGGYQIASLLHLSGPLAVVITGLMISHEQFQTRSFTSESRAHLFQFWELLDVLLNAILFVLIGLEVVILVLDTDYIIAGLLVIPLVLLARFIAVSLPIKALERRLAFAPKTPLIMTWGGLRGGISIALALALTDDMSRELFLTMSYIVVFFSIVAQGLTLERLVRWVREA